MSRRNGKHKVPDENEMAENCLEGSLDIGSVLRMDFPKINFSLGFFSPWRHLYSLLLLVITQDVMSWEDRWGMEPPKHK